MAAPPGSQLFYLLGVQLGWLPVPLPVAELLIDGTVTDRSVLNRKANQHRNASTAVEVGRYERVANKFHFNKRVFNRRCNLGFVRFESRFGGISIREFGFVSEHWERVTNRSSSLVFSVEVLHLGSQPSSHRVRSSSGLLALVVDLHELASTARIHVSPPDSRRDATLDSLGSSRVPTPRSPFLQQAMRVWLTGVLAVGRKLPGGSL